MLSRFIQKSKFTAIVVLVISGGFSQNALQSGNQMTDVQDIIRKTDSILVSQHKPLGYGEKQHIVREIYSEAVDSLDHYLNRYASHSRFNGTVAVAKDGVVLFKKHHGYADMDKRIPVSDTSKFQLASVSKQFTAAAILKLYQEGRINLDSSITTYIPELPYKRVKIRHLLTHKSGFPSYMWIIARHWNENYAPSNEDLVQMISEHPVRLRFKPGKRFNYSNTGYCLLASVVERTSGLSFDEFLKDRFFDPLNMKRTFAFSSSDTAYTPDMVKGYNYHRSGYHEVSLNLMDGTYGDKGVFSTAEDLVKWTQALENGKVVDESLVKNAFSETFLDGGKEVEYGYGFRIYTSNAYDMIFHNGSWSGFRTTLRTFPEDGLTIVILTNNSFRDTGAMARNLTSAIYNDFEAGEVYDIVKSLILEGKELDSISKKSIVDSWELHELRKVKRTVNSMNRRWMAHKIERFTRDAAISDDTYYALKEK